MANAVQILNDVCTSKFGNISSTVEEFLQPVLSKTVASGCQEAKCYSNFVMKFLHSLTGRVKGLKNDSDIIQVLDSTVLCCRAYTILQQGLKPDAAYTVPKIVYHIINHFKTEHTHLDLLIRISDLVYEMLYTEALGVEAHTLVNGLYACLWNICCKLAATIDKGSLKDLDVRLQLRRCSLLFLSLLPDKDILIDKLRCVLSLYYQVSSDATPSPFLTSCCDITCQMFRGIIDSIILQVPHLTESLHLVFTLKGMYVEHLVKCLRISDAVTVSESILKIGSGESSKLSEALSLLYTFSCGALLENNDKVKTSELDFQQVVRGAKLVHELVSKSDMDADVLVLLYEPLNFLTQMVGKKSLSGSSLSAQDTETLLELCDEFLKLSVMLVDNESKQKKEEGKKNEEKGRLFHALLTVHYRQLQFMLQHIQADGTRVETSRHLLGKCVELVSLFQERLDHSSPHIVSSVQYTFRYNCGYVCSSLGKVCVQEKLYEWATSFYTIAVHQLHLCHHANLPRLYDMLVECYVKQEKWVEGSRAVIEAATRINEVLTLTFVTTLWTRLKLAALEKGEYMFHDLSLCVAMRSAGVSVPSITDRQLLFAEYQAWKKMARKNQEVKHLLLCEMYEVPQDPMEKGEIMVDLAISMCITGYTHRDRTAGELLTSAILLLDKRSGPTAEALLALAHYTKYVVCHEEAIEKMQHDSANQSDSEAGKNQQINGSHMTFTFQSEQSYLPYLERAILLWESSLGHNGGKCQKGQEVKGEGETEVDLEQHIDALILCGSRLLAMRQTKLAWRALRVARAQLERVSDQKQAGEMWTQLSQVLLLLGRYKEAEEIIREVINHDPSDRNCLLYAELCLLMGKREEGLATLNPVLERQELSKRTLNVLLIDGTAKRLLSMFLCFPEGHVILPTNEYLLSLAFEAVRCHISVLNFITSKKTADNNTDKWLLLHEILQSLLHLCRLYRFIGLPRDALCYLKEGLRISQATGLPRWSCEFLFEMLHIRSLTAECDQAVEIVESINSILATSELNSSSNNCCGGRAGNKNSKVTEKTDASRKSKTKQSITGTDVEQICEELKDCFGFDELSMRDIPKPAVNVTPEKEFVKEELSSAKKEQLSKISLPQCSCEVEKKDECEDDVRHKLCLKAGIALSEFLSQSDMRDTADKLLVQLDVYLKGKNTVMDNKTSVNLCRKIMLNNGAVQVDPQMVYICLEASCVQAENYLQQKEFHKIQKVWENLSDLEQTGYLKNVLHSNILMSRLALCNATSYMFTNQSIFTGNQNQSQTVIGNQPAAERGSDITSQDLESFSTGRKKVSFGEDCSDLIVKGTATKMARRKLLKDVCSSMNSESGKIENISENESSKLPLKTKGSFEAFATPKGKSKSTVFSSTKKQQLSKLLMTPINNRQAALDLLIESGSDDDDGDTNVVFPALKPVTPKVQISDRAKGSDSRPKKRRSKNAKAGKTNLANVSESIPDTVNKRAEGIKIEIDIESEGMTNEKKDEHSDETAADEIDDLEAGVESLSLDNVPKTKSKIPLAVKKADKEDQDGKRTSQGRVRNPAGRKSKMANKENQNNNIDDVSVLEKDVEFDEKEMSAALMKKEMVLTEKNAEIKVIHKLKAIPGDIYDFDLEASPSVGKPLKKGKGKNVKPTAKVKVQKSVSSVKKKNSKTTISNIANGVENSSMIASPSEKPEAKAKTTRARRGKKAEAVESVRNTSMTDSEIELNISYQEVELENDIISENETMNASLDAFCMPEPCTELLDIDEGKSEILEAPVESPVAASVTLVLDEHFNEFNHLGTAGLKLDPDELDPIEIMRGDTKRRGKTRATRSRKSDDTALDAESNNDEEDKEDEPVAVVSGNTKKKGRGRQKKNDGDDSMKDVADDTEDEGDERCGAGVEKMRSGKLASLKGLTDRISCEPEVCAPTQSVPAGESSPIQSSLVPCLESLYHQTRHLAPYPQHPDLCHLLALHYLHTDPHRAAFLLTDSIAVTFRHQAMMNVASKVRKHSEVTPGGASVSCDQLTGVRDELLFDKDEQHLEKMINVIPNDWTVIQLSIVNAGLPCRQFLLTRFVRDQPPVVLRLPAFTTPQGRDLLKDFSNLLEANRGTAKIDSKEEWWALRNKLEKDLQTITEHMEMFWIGPWKSVFLPREYSGDIIQAVQKQVLREARLEINVSQTEILLLAVKELSDPQLLQCASELLRSQANPSQLTSLVSVIKTHAEPDLSKADSHHVVLILDKTVQHLPWESLNCLLPLSVSRMPCLAHLYTHLTYLHSHESSVFIRGVDPHNTYYIVNPDSNLQHCEEKFKDWFQGEKSWNGVIGMRPTKEQFTEALTNNDLLIYCGHGSGGRFFNSDEIEKLQGRAATILMGCSSGKLLAKGQLEPSGMMISYFLAGCPCMVANLWDVTDKDIDKFTEELLRSWLSSDEGSLPRFVQKARQACKMKYLNGSAPVVYGLPVFIRKSSR